MIPNIFISSTIADLHYLRDALRDAIEELAYHPVMSEYGEVGYLNPTSAADSCYRSVRQCQMVVLIIGKRYGSVGDDGLSVTHSEFRASQDQSLPTITLVESQVLHYKEVYDADRGAEMWNNFGLMDRAKSTFGFLDDVSRSEAYNAIVPFTSVGDAKRKLKLQLADFVGDRLTEAVPRVSENLREVLAEVKTLRNQITQSSPDHLQMEQNSKRYLTVTRFLFNEKTSDYRSFLKTIFGDIDSAIDAIPSCSTLSEVLSKANYSYEIHPIKSLESLDSKDKSIVATSRSQLHGTSDWDGYDIRRDGRISFTQGEFDRLAERHAELLAKLAAA